MSALTHTHEPPRLPRKDVIYPEDDGNPMSDNTLQFEWITTLHFGFLALFANDPNVFVASDLLWYPVEGDAKTRAAPDVMIAFGRPKGNRGSYKQWEEEGIAPQVVIEILSPGNRPIQMIEEHRFYEQHGVEEYFIYDPQPGEERLVGYLRSGDHLMLLPDMQGWISPRVGVKFELADGKLICTRHDGKVFEPYLDVMLRAEAEAERANRLAAKLRELGIDPASI